MKILSNKQGGKSGSTLIWALVVVMVLAIILAAGLAVVQNTHSRGENIHMENQAY
jgi:type II secretory pathway component PulK